MRLSGRTLAVACGFAALAPATALAQTGDRVSLSPSVLEGTVSAGSRLGPMTLSNGSSMDYDVVVSAAMLSQARDGSIGFADDAENVRRARRLLAVGVERFPFTPGTVRSVFARVREDPRGDHGLYAGVLYRIEPRQRGGVRNVIEFGALLLLDPPNPRPRLTAVDLAVQQAGPRRLRALASVRNEGNVDVEPTALLRVRDAGGRLVVRREIDVRRVLPGALIDVPIGLGPTMLPSGDYSASVTLRGAGRPARVLHRFTLFDTNQVRFADAELAGFDAPTVYGGQPAELRATFRNTGNVAFRPSAEVDVRALDEGTTSGVLRTVHTTVEQADPGDEGAIRAAIDLPAGERFRLDLRLTAPGGDVLDRRSVTFAVQVRPTLIERIRRWIEDNAVPVVVGLVVALLLGIVAAAVALRRRGREPGAPMDAPAPHAVPTMGSEAGHRRSTTPVGGATGEPGTVELNGASIEELQSLPGIGPVTARRIVAYRDQYGRFEAIDELRWVDGFGERRVDALRHRVRLDL